MKTLLLTFALLISTLSFAQSHWKYRKEKQGVQVYTRHDSISGIQEIKLRAEVKATLNQVMAIAGDFANMHNWAYRLKEAYVIKEISDYEGYLYMRTDFPIPFSDRDMVVHYVRSQDPHTLQIVSTAKSVHHMVPEKHGVVRIKTLETKWTYTPLKNGHIRLEYQLKSDPAGSIPKWMINMAADEGPLKSITGFKSQLPKYQNKQLALWKE